MRRAIAFFVLAGLLVVAAFVYALAPFSVSGIFASGPAGTVERSECSAAARQLVDPPALSTERAGTTITIHNAHPACEEAGQSRALTSGALLLAGALAMVIGLLFRPRREGRADEPSPSSSSIGS